MTTCAFCRRLAADTFEFAGGWLRGDGIRV